MQLSATAHIQGLSVMSALSLSPLTCELLVKGVDAAAYVSYSEVLDCICFVSLSLGPQEISGGCALPLLGFPCSSDSLKTPITSSPSLALPTASNPKSTVLVMIVMNSALTLLSLFTFFSLSVRAQYVSSSGSSPTSSAGASSETDSGSACTPGNVHQVTVGKNGNQFDPSITFAHPGDVVVFSFFPSNHSVIRTDYTGTKSDTEYSHNPCVPIEVLQPGTKGFFSGNKLLESPPSSGNVSARTVRERAPLTLCS